MSLEQRQLAKVQPLISHEGHVHTYTKKGRMRPCPSCRLEKKRIKHEENQTAITALTEISKELIAQLGFVTGNGLRALGQVGRGLAENSDPIAQAAFAGAAWLTFSWFVTTYPGFAKATHLDRFPNVWPGGKVPAPPDPNGRFCFLVKDHPTLGRTCYATATERDEAIGHFNLLSNGALTAEPFDRPIKAGVFAVRGVRPNGTIGTLIVGSQADVDSYLSQNQQRLINEGVYTRIFVEEVFV